MGSSLFFFFSSRRRHTRWTGDWSSDVCSSDLKSVSDDVRKRVLKAIKKLKYEPDRVAQSMRLGVTRTVACATRDISMPGYRSEERRVGKEGRCRWWPDQ